jgi:hypothetical protein
MKNNNNSSVPFEVPFEVADDVLAHRPLGQQIGEPALGSAVFRGKFAGRQWQGTGDGEAAADPLGIVAKPDGPGRIAPKLANPALLVPEDEGVGIAHEDASPDLPVR